MDQTWISENTWVSAKTEPAAPGARVEVGDRLGSYRLIKQLGAGGMGSVFVGEHEVIGRRVAIKLLHPDFALDADVARRFMLEARLANSIASKHVVEVEDFARTPEGLCYLVMELLEGSDLEATVAADGLLPLARSLPIVRQLAEALAAAHQSRIVHRDIKPANVFLSRNGEDRDVVKVLDFGLGKLVESQGRQGGTAAGMILGTPEYMSPEQAFGLSVDSRTDVYAFGAVLFWLLAGRVPFEGETLQAQQLARQKPAPPLPPKTAKGEAIPSALSRLVAECLAANPAARPQTMWTVIERLDALGRPLGPTAMDRPVTRARPMIGVAIVAVLALAAGGWLVARRPAAAPQDPPDPAPTTEAATPPPTRPPQGLAPLPPAPPAPLARQPDPAAALQAPAKPASPAPAPQPPAPPPAPAAGPPRAPRRHPRRPTDTASPLFEPLPDPPNGR